MPRLKERIKIIHRPSTKEIFLSLASMPSWSRILFEHSTNPYCEFLGWLMDRDFLEQDERIIIRNISKNFGADPVKISKWLSEIYNDILDLNYERSELFKSDGKRHELHFQYFDSYGVANVWLLSTPRLYEGLSFPFINAKVGARSFFVDDVDHIIDEGTHCIRVNLSGGSVNRYREFMVERARFEGLIDYWTFRDSFSHDLDDNLRKWYRQFSSYISINK